MNVRLGFTLLAALAAGCSGATPQLVEAAPDGAASSGAGGSSSGGSSSGASSSGSGEVTPDSGTIGASAPTTCPSNGKKQTPGGGQSQGAATAFNSVACGTLDAGQFYWWTFELPKSASKFGIAFTGGIAVELTVQGTTVNILPGTNLPFHTETPYYLKVSPVGTAPETYVLVVSEQ
jgi:hypothetical protein